MNAIFEIKATLERLRPLFFCAKISLCVYRRSMRIKKIARTPRSSDPAIIRLGRDDILQVNLPLLPFDDPFDPMANYAVPVYDKAYRISADLVFIQHIALRFR